MRVLKFLSLFTLLCILVPASQSFAQDEMMEEEESHRVLTLEEARDLINESPAASDAVGGTVPTDGSIGVYDIYSRQLAYRENAKELRSSLEERRENFQKPSVEILENHRKVIAKVYAAETKAYLDETSGEEDDMEGGLFDEGAMQGPMEPKETMVSSDAMTTEEPQDLKEMPIPAEGDVEDAPKRKVITTDDAPEFDPSAL